MNLRRLLIVVEPGKDGAFELAAGVINFMHAHAPEATIDLAYSSCRAGAKLPLLVQSVRDRGGKAIDLRIGNGPQPADLAASWHILQLVRQRHIQVVHAHSSKAGALCRLLRFAIPGFPPVLYSPHAYYGLGGMKDKKSLFYNLLESLFGRVGRTICCSPDEKNFAQDTLRIPPGRLLVINNGIDLDRFAPVDATTRSLYRQELGLSEETLLLISVGRDSAQKNYPPLYQALDPLLAAPGTSLFFAHAGAGSARLGESLSPMARVRFRAFEHLDRIERLLSAADAFILTSRYEGLSLGALQALGSGLKTFLTRVPGNACLREIGFTDIAWIAPSEDATTLSSAIRRELETWLAQPEPPSPRQLTVARENVSDPVQLEKLHQLYERTAAPA